jgi:nucleoid DNA-binding protein
MDQGCGLGARQANEGAGMIGAAIPTSPFRTPDTFLKGHFREQDRADRTHRQERRHFKAAATRALEATIGAVKTTLRKGGTVSLVGFGTFAVGKRAARTGRPPPAQRLKSSPPRYPSSVPARR